MGIKNSDKRKSFRIPVSVPVTVYRQEDKEYQNPEECILVNIGVGGACVDSKYQYAENEILNFRIKLENYQVMSLPGQVIRITEMESGQYRYGIMFSQVWDDEQTYLDHILNRMKIQLKRKKS